MTMPQVCPVKQTTYIDHAARLSETTSVLQTALLWGMAHSSIATIISKTTNHSEHGAQYYQAHILTKYLHIRQAFR